MKSETREEMEISPFFDQISNSFQFPSGILDFPVSGGNDRSSLGFVELLGLQDFPNSLFDFPPPNPVNLQSDLPATPNSSSISSSSTEAPNAVTAPAAGEEEVDPDNTNNKSKTPSKGGKKKGQKRDREPRFAFMTKSEVDHLEDGYRWRKYGQKAVKNSPFPRSYYRCTTANCGVKKRVERSCKDPTVVVTTYEGQHTHQSPAMPRGGHQMAPPQQFPEHFFSPPVQFNMPFFASYLPPPMDFLHVASSAVADRRYCNSSTADVNVRDHGLLEDVIKSDIGKKEE